MTIPSLTKAHFLNMWLLLSCKKLGPSFETFVMITLGEGFKTRRVESSGSCLTDLMRTGKKDNWEKSQKMFLKIICNFLTSGKKCRGSRKNDRIGITALHCRSGLHVVLWVTRCGSSSEQSLQNTKINISEGLWNLMACGMWGRQWATCQALQVNPPRAHTPFQAVWGRTERRNLAWSPISRLAQLFYQSPDLPWCSQWAESLRASWLRFQEDWLQWLQSRERMGGSYLVSRAPWITYPCTLRKWWG